MGMKSVTTAMLLRIAAAISAVFTAGHAMGGLKKWSPIGDNEVLRQMTTVHFQTMGATRSYLDFYLGFGWSVTVAMALHSILLWQLASPARVNGALVRPMIGTFILAIFASGAIAWWFIFPLPAIFSAALLVPLVWAYVIAR